MSAEEQFARRRTKNSRAVILTAKGEKKLQELLGLSISSY